MTRAENSFDETIEDHVAAFVSFFLFFNNIELLNYFINPSTISLAIFYVIKIISIVSFVFVFLDVTAEKRKTSLL